MSDGFGKPTHPSLRDEPRLILASPLACQQQNLGGNSCGALIVTQWLQSTLATSFLRVAVQLARLQALVHQKDAALASAATAQRDAGGALRRAQASAKKVALHESAS